MGFQICFYAAAGRLEIRLVLWRRLPRLTACCGGSVLGRGHPSLVRAPASGASSSQGATALSLPLPSMHRAQELVPL